MTEYTYSFFDYKYNIAGYSGQEFDGPQRFWYMAFALISALLLAVALRKMKPNSMRRYLRTAGFTMIVLEIAKVTWESVWDIRTGRGFNAGGILSLETCSLFMPMALVCGFGRGKWARAAGAWLASIGLTAGLSNVFFLQGLKWYPMFTFGAFHSMIYHYVMVLTAALIVSTGFIRFRAGDIPLAFAMQCLLSLIAVPLDHIMGWDYALFREAHGIPFLSDLGSELLGKGLSFITTLIMYALYFVICAVFIGLWMLFERRRSKKGGVLSAEEARAGTIRKAR